MNRDKLFELHLELNKKGLEIMKAKNADYSIGDDALSNFKMSEFISVPPALGLLVRCLDKIKRIEAFIVRGDLKVTDESVGDSIIDLRNYMVLLAGLIDDSYNDLLHSINPYPAQSLRIVEDELLRKIPCQVCKKPILLVDAINTTICEGGGFKHSDARECAKILAKQKEEIKEDAHK